LGEQIVGKISIYFAKKDGVFYLVFAT